MTAPRRSALRSIPKSPLAEGLRALYAGALASLFLQRSRRRAAAS